MDLQAEKIELVKQILNTNDSALINQISSLFKHNDEIWLDELPAHVQESLAISIEQANRGEFISYSDVKKKVAALLKA